MSGRKGIEIMADKKIRSSNLELYRIIVMLLIVAHHYVVNSGYMAQDGPIMSNITSGKSLFLLLFGAWGKTGINCFVLITGYFMCKSNITLKKFCKLLFQVLFYRIIIGGIFLLASYDGSSFGGYVLSLIPVRGLDRDFTPAFLIFFLCIPFLNILVKNMTEKQHIMLLGVVSFAYIFLGTFPLFAVNMNYVSWFIVLYFISSYIRLYPKKIFENTLLWGILTIVFVGVASLSVFVCSRLDSFPPYYFVTDSNTLLAVLVGVSSFLFFKNLKIRNSKLINTISQTCFGVLLIHANSDMMRSFLWKDILDNVGMYSSEFLVPHAFLSVFGVFAVCSVIDLCRIYLIETPFFKLWDKKYNKFSDWYKKKEEKVLYFLQVKDTSEE